MPKHFGRNCFGRNNGRYNGRKSYGRTLCLIDCAFQQVIDLVRQYGTHLKNLLIYDRVVEAVQRFCANHSIDEV